MKNLYLLIFLLTASFSIEAQIDPNSLMGLPTVPTLGDVNTLTGVNPGNIVYIEDINKIYTFNGTAWVEILDETKKIIAENELLFEDVNYYYVSIIINTSDWMVTRFNKANINDEGNASGTGTQPNTLVACTGLTYN